MDPTYPLERLAFILEDTNAPVLLTQAHLVDGLPSHKVHVVCLDADLHTRAIAQECDENPVSDATPANLVYVIYTSGSTGQPKGTLLAHRGLCNLVTVYAQELDLGPDARVLQFFSFGFDGSVADIFSALLSGASLCLPRRETVMSMPDLRRLMQKQAVTHLLMTPSALAVLPADGLPALRTVLSGGESCTKETVARWSPSRGFINAYGLTETTVATSLYEVGELSQELTNTPVGSPIANTRLYILDWHLQPMPVGVSGELCIGGVGVARGYLKRPELTAERFIPDPFSETLGTRLYRTGDLARYRPDGNIEFLGRMDYQVKIRGYRIELGEIEAALGRHPAVQETVVLAREDVAGDKRLVAYVVPTADGGELRSYLKDKLPEYMLPAVFVTLEALPLTPNGKVDRRALPAPEGADLGLTERSVAPQDALELRLVRIWESVLGVQPIGVNHNFFDLGGHSLLAVRLLARVYKELGQQLPLVTLFQGATVRQLAEVLRQRQGADEAFSSLVQIQAGDGNKRPLFFVHPVGGSVLCYADLSRHLEPDQPFYGLQALGLAEEQQPHTRVEVMARHYLDLIQTVQVEGPYLLGGWSIGGVIALEMAQQLQAQGQSVALLALLDSHAPQDDRERKPDDVELLASFALDLGLPLHDLKLDHERLKALGADERLAWVLEQVHKARLLPEDIGLAQTRRIFQVFKHNVRAVRQYEPRPYPGAVALFKAREWRYENEVAADLGWSALVDGGVNVHEVPGNHYTLVREPNVASLAEQLGHYLFA
jgi:amino acid adenylation domain-containing protein